MSPERFAHLAQAYGADLARWPAAVRLEAEQWRDRSPDAAAVLSQARDLDEILNGFRVAAPSADLQRRIMTTLLRQQEPGLRLGRWLSGVGAVGVLGTGALAGAMAMTLVLISLPAHTDTDTASPLYEQSSFGDLASGGASAAPAATT